MEARHLDPRLLTRCLRRGRDDDLQATLRGMDVEAWRALVDGAVWHGVAPLLYHRLARSEGLAIPPGELERLRDLHLHCLLRNQAILEQLAELIRETTEAGHSVLVLKGAYLSNCVYEEAALRPTGDIDLLALPHDVEGAQRHLMALGYRYAAGTEAIDYSRLHHLRRLSKPGSVDVEVHHDLAPRWAPFEHDIAGLWHRATRTKVGELDLLHQAPDDLLLHLCAHAAFNDEFRTGLSAACDVDAVVRKFGHELDWARFARTANLDGRARFAYVTLRLTRALLDTPIPEDVFDALDHDRADDGVTEEVVGYVLSTEARVPVTLEIMGDATSVKAKVAMLWRGVFPPPEVMRRLYRLRTGSKLQFLYYAVRPFDLLVRRGRQILGLFIGSPRARSEMEKERGRRIIGAWARGSTPEA